MVSFSSIFLLSSVVKQLVPKEFSAIQDKEAQSMLANLQSVPLKVSSLVSSDAIDSTYGYYPKKSAASNANAFPNAVGVKSNRPAVLGSLLSLFCKESEAAPNSYVLLHGFDSSCLEFRQLAPMLAETGDVYAPDILGWGFSNCNAVSSFSPDAKIEHLKCFLAQVVKKPCVLIGASLGGAIAVQLAVENPSSVKKLVLLDAQGFIEGVPSDIPDFAASFGIQILKSWPLRIYAGFLSYRNKTLSTFDAARIGRLHCLTSSWQRASIAFLKSGGFRVSSLIPLVKQDTLVVWGKYDEILNVKTADQFKEKLPKNQVVIIDECGHVPHIEKARETCHAIVKFTEN